MKRGGEVDDTEAIVQVQVSDARVELIQRDEFVKLAKPDTKTPIDLVPLVRLSASSDLELRLALIPTQRLHNKHVAGLTIAQTSASSHTLTILLKMSRVTIDEFVLDRTSARKEEPGEFVISLPAGLSPVGQD